MCCIFTCCGWLIDLIQRAWTFTMSCIIMSAVGGVMVTASMSGIALGYNYSLAEYIDLKETNVSVYLKRGVFDDEIADDMDWRRAGHLPVQGQLKDENLRTGAPADDDSTTLRSGRRLDDSVFEADDQNKYEGSLMKLTAKPAYQDTLRPIATDDVEMADTLTKFSLQPLDQMKAIQSLIDSRRAMATGGTTLSPMATYEPAGPVLAYLPSNNNPNLDVHPEAQYRRMMAPGPGSLHITLSPLNPARAAVPDPASLESAVNWLGPKQPAIFVQSKLPEFFVRSPTYPRPVTVAPAIVRPTGQQEPDLRRYPGSVAFPYPFSPQKPEPTPPSPTRQAGLNDMDKQPDFYNEKILAEGNEISKNENMINRPPKWGMKSQEEEYEDEIKGLPVRKRRSITSLVREERNPAERNIIRPTDNESPKRIDILTLVKNYFKTVMQTTSNEEDSNNENNIATDKNHTMIEEMNDTQIKISHKGTTKQRMDIDEKHDSNVTSEAKIIPERDINETKVKDSQIIISEKGTTKQRMDIDEKHDSNVINEAKIIPERDINETKVKDSQIIISEKGTTKQRMDIDKKHDSNLISEAKIIPERDINETKVKTSLLNYLVTSLSSAKKTRIKTKRESLESRLVSSKYGTNDLAKRLKKQQLISNQEILDSISINLNEAGLLRDPVSSPLVKLLQATLTA